MIGERYNWGFGSPEASGTSGSNIDASSHYYFGRTVSYGQSTYNISMGEIDPGVVISDGPSPSSFPNGILTPLFDVVDSFSPMTASSARWLGNFFHLGPMPVNGVTPLMEVPVLRYSPNQRVQYFGSLPNWRYCSMTVSYTHLRAHET